MEFYRLITIAVDSYNEQKTDIMNNQKVIYSSFEISSNGGGSFVKCIGTHGFPESGNFWGGDTLHYI